MSMMFPSDPYSGTAWMQPQAPNWQYPQATWQPPQQAYYPQQPVQQPTVSVMPLQQMDLNQLQASTTYTQAPQQKAQTPQAGFENTGFADEFSLSPEPMPAAQQQPVNNSQDKALLRQIDDQQMKIDSLTSRLAEVEQRKSSVSSASSRSTAETLQQFGEFIRSSRGTTATFLTLTALSVVTGGALSSAATLFIPNLLVAGVGTLLLRAASRFLPQPE